MESKNTREDDAITPRSEKNQCITSLESSNLLSDYRSQLVQTNTSELNLGALPNLEITSNVSHRQERPQKDNDAPPKENTQKGGKRVFSEKVREGEFTDYGKKLIATYDDEKKGFLTKEQIVKQLENPSLQGKEAQALAAMYSNFSSLENLTSPKSRWDPRGISYEDLDKFKNDEKVLENAFRDSQSVKNFVANNSMKKFDSDNSQSLTRAELDAGLANPRTAEAERKALQLLRDNFSSIGAFYDRSIDNNSMKDFADRFYSSKENADTIRAVSQTCSEVNSCQRMEISHDLYADKNDPLKSITPDAVRQGKIGNCYFLAPLASLAQSNPSLIKDSIRDNADGTYTVTFKGAPDEPITVKAPTQAELGLFNHGSSQGTWAAVMEKAYGAYCQQAIYRRSPFNIRGGNLPAEGGDGGGFNSSSIKFLTGNSVSKYRSFFNGEETLAAKLDDAFKNKKTVTAGIDGGIIDRTSVDGFPLGHAYSIIDFKADGNKSGSVTLRNPWAQGDGVGGKITITLKQFRKNFTDIDIED